MMWKPLYEFKPPSHSYWQMICADCGQAFLVHQSNVGSVLFRTCEACKFLDHFSAARRDWYLEWLEQEMGAP